MRRKRKQYAKRYQQRMLSTGVLFLPLATHFFFSSSKKVDNTNSRVLNVARSVNTSMCGTGSTFRDIKRNKGKIKDLLPI